MKHHLSLSATLLLLLISTITANAANSNPDFSFPKDVIKSADSTLIVALKNGDGNGIISSLIKYSIAKSSISHENFQDIASRIDSIAKVEKNEVTKAILYSIEAEIYSSNSSYNWFRGAKPTEIDSYTYPQDITEWSDSDYSRKITELINKSLSNKELLSSTTIQDYRSVINYDENGALYKPTIFDFLSHRAIEMIRVDSEKLNKAKIINALLEFNKNNPAQYIYTTLQNSEISQNPDSLFALYDKFKQSEHSGLILCRINNSYDEARRAKLHGLSKEYIVKFSNSFLRPNVENVLQNCEAKDIKIMVSEAETTDKPVKIEHIINNVNNYKISIYRIPDNITTFSSRKTPLSQLTLIETKEFNNSNKIPFCDTIKFAFKPLQFGRYIVVPNCKLSNKSNLESLYRERYNSLIHVSNIKLITIGNNNKTTDILAVSAIDGSPIKGVKIINTNKKAKSLKWITDKNGICKIPANYKENINVIGTKGDDVFTQSIHLYNSYFDTQQKVSGTILTDLGVYRPGDSIKVVAMCYSQMKNGYTTAKQQKFTLNLFNPNYEKIDSLDATTDDFGRINASFRIPKDGLNGDFKIAIYNTTDNTEISRKEIKVSEYKSPSFQIEFVDFKSSYNINDSINIKGTVKSFSGVALAGVNVDLSLYKMLWMPFRFYDGGEKFVEEFKIKTDSKGEFSITLSTSLILESNFNQVRVNATATSQAGESQSVSNMFLINNFSKLSITPDCSINIDSVAKLPINISQENPFTCEYEILNSDNVAVHSGSFNSADYSVNLSSLASGKYKLSAKILNDSISNDQNSIILYHSTDSISPVESPLWIPATNVQCDKNNVARITIGNSTPKSNIYYTVSTDNVTLESGWIYYNKGIKQFELKIPHDIKGDIKVQFITTQNNITTSKIVDVKAYKDVEKISIIYNSFRDKITPNSLEKWSFNVINNDSIPQQAAFIAEMFDHAINSINSNTWVLNIPKLAMGFKKLSFYNNNYPIVQWWSKREKPTTIVDIKYPELNLYNQHSIIIRSYNLFTSRTGGLNIRKSMAVNEMEMSKFEDVAVTAMGIQSAELSPKESPVISYRMNDVKTAFWEPLLTTDENGNVAIDFMVPENNTTWFFQAVAYTSDMLETSISTEVLANKPIMVKPNLPRFLRHGDMATISAQVLNATDSIENCKIEIQLFDVTTNKVLLTKHVDATISANSDKGFHIEYCIPDTISFLGYRIKASNHTFGDGEQSLIAILPATSPVIESMPFFIDEKETNYSFTLPKYPANATVTLEYCDNPVWYCVTAIPSMQSLNYTTANGVASTIFTNLIAKGILNTYPTIKTVLNDWAKNPNNTNLTSMLSKNEELKTVNLKNTPWLPQAQKENILMSQLASFADNDNIANTTSKAITSLKELQQKDGGWGWFSGCESSMYITYEIMHNLGYLQNLGFTEDNKIIKTIIKNGVKYIDNNLIELMKSKRPYDSHNLLPYLYVRSMFSDIPLSATLTQFKNSALLHVENNWKKMSMGDKAFSAIALSQNGKMNIAKEIVESLRQFSITKPSTGMYWDNIKSSNYYIYNNVALTSLMLQAFNAVEPKCDDINQIRKWLLLQKQTTNWGSYTMAGDAVYSLLSTGSNWINDDDNKAIITLNSTPISLDSVASNTGYIKQAITLNSSAENVVSISRSGNNPAWGSVFSQYIAPMQSIKSKSIDQLSIEKALYKNIDGKLKKVSSFEVGDKVTVRFTIKASRDLDYVNLTDERSACIEPIEQLSGVEYSNGVAFYKEIKKASTNLYFNRLSKGTHIIDYQVYITAPGSYSLGIATVQCQYAPQMVANSSAEQITAK